MKGYLYLSASYADLINLIDFKLFFIKGTTFVLLAVCFSAHESPFEKGSLSLG